MAFCQILNTNSDTYKTFNNFRNEIKDHYLNSIRFTLNNKEYEFEYCEPRLAVDILPNIITSNADLTMTVLLNTESIKFIGIRTIHMKGVGSFDISFSSCVKSTQHKQPGAGRSMAPHFGKCLKKAERVWNKNLAINTLRNYLKQFSSILSAFPRAILYVSSTLESGEENV